MVTIPDKKVISPTLVTTGALPHPNLEVNRAFNLSTENQAIEDEENRNSRGSACGYKSKTSGMPKVIL